MRTLNISVLFIFCALTAFMANFSVCKQTLVMISGFNAEKQSDVSATYENAFSLQTEQSYLPAGLIVFKYADLNNRSFADNLSCMQRMIASAIQLKEIQLLANYSEKGITKHCN